METDRVRDWKMNAETMGVRLHDARFYKNPVPEASGVPNRKTALFLSDQSRPPTDDEIMEILERAQEMAHDRSPIYILKKIGNGEWTYRKELWQETAWAELHSPLHEILAKM